MSGTQFIIKQKLVEQDPDDPEIQQPFVLDVTILDDARVALQALKNYLILWRALMEQNMAVVRDQAYPNFDPTQQVPGLITSVVVTTSFDTYIQNITNFLQDTLSQLEQASQTNIY